MVNLGVFELYCSKKNELYCSKKKAAIHSFICSFCVQNSPYLSLSLLTSQYPSHRVDHFRREARYRVDTKDPNPAHRLQRSLQELTIKEGAEFNPRFNPNLESNTLRRNRMATMPGSQAYTKLGFHRPRAATIHSFPGLNEERRKSPELKRASAFTLRERSPPRSEDCPTDLPERVSALRLLDCSSQSSEESSLDDTELVAAEVEATLKGQDALSHNQENPRDNDIIGMQIENSGSETTVYLTRLLDKGNNGQRNGNRWGGMPSIEEDESEDSEDVDKLEEEEEEEEEKEVIGPEPSKLCHPIPQLVVYDEEDGVVETVSSQSSLPQIEVFDFDYPTCDAPKRKEDAWGSDTDSGLKTSFTVVPSIAVTDSTDQTIPVEGSLGFSVVMSQ